MEILTILLSILQLMSVSLGVGASTLAVLNFFVALKDGKIDEHERNLMGVVYIVLRVAMVLILITTFCLSLISMSHSDFAAYMTTFKLTFWTLIFMLYLNAVLMTKHLISSTFGPAIQAATWYTLGVMTALLSLNLHNFHYYQFILGYLSAIMLGTIVINVVLMHLKSKK